MTVTLDEAIDTLNITDDDLSWRVQLYVDAANEWIEANVDEDYLERSTVKLATLFLVEHFWNSSQRGPTGPDVGEDFVMVSGIGYAIPNRVKELLGISLAQSGPSYEFPEAVAFPDPAEWPV